MKKIVWITLFLFVLTACTTPAPAASATPEDAATPCVESASCPVLNSEATVTEELALNTYTSKDYPLHFSYPSVYDQGDNTCALKEETLADGSDSIKIGRQTFILISDPTSDTLEAAADNYVASSQIDGLKILSEEKERKFGVDGLRVELGLGDSTSYGTVTFVFFRGKLYTYGYTAGVFCKGESKIIDTVVIGDQIDVPN